MEGSNIKITSVRAIPWSPDPTPDSYGVLAARNFVAVKVETDEGITGWGDATIGPLAVAKLVEEFGAIIIGEDPARIDYHWERLYHLNHVQGGPMQLSAIAGIEMALWDNCGILKVKLWEYPYMNCLEECIGIAFGPMTGGMVTHRSLQ